MKIELEKIWNAKITLCTWAEPRRLTISEDIIKIYIYNTLKILNVNEHKELVEVS